MTDSCGTSELEIDTTGQNVAQNSVDCPVVLGWDVLEWDRLQKWKFMVLGSFRPSQSDVCCEVGGGCDPWLHGTLSEVGRTGRTAWTVSCFRPNPTVGRKRTTGKTDSPSHLDTFSHSFPAATRIWNSVPSTAFSSNSPDSFKICVEVWVSLSPNHTPSNSPPPQRAPMPPPTPHRLLLSWAYHTTTTTIMKTVLPSWTSCGPCELQCQTWSSSASLP